MTTPLKIALYCPEAKDAQRWAQALHLAMPEATVEPWPTELSQADYAVVWSPSQAFLDAHANVKTIFNLGAGVDALLKLRLPKSVPVVRLEDAGMGMLMVQYVGHAVLRHYRMLDTLTADMQSGLWRPRFPRPMEDFPVGIMGLGVLGQQVARRLQNFGFPVAGWSRSPKHIDGVQCYYGADQLHQFLAATRVLVCLLPLTPDTEGIINRRSLAQLMPPGYVINVARGAHVVDDDLIAMIDSGHLAGATLDVFRTEPLPPDHAFRSRPQITLTPHISAQTQMGETIAQIARKIAALQRGEPITGVVDMAKAY